MKLYLIVLSLLSLHVFPVFAAENILLITLDGVRWQEVFTGIDRDLAVEKKYAAQSDKLMKSFWSDSPKIRAEKLMPFLHKTVFPKGTVVGDRNRRSCAQVSNPWYFSYPGYSEILTGIVDPSIDSNKKVPNRQKTFMELLKPDKRFREKMAAFASWDVFPYIFNTERSGLYVNAFHNDYKPRNALESTLNQLQEDIPTPWTTVRHDAFTHHYAKSYIETEKPRIIYIAYGETDDFAHDGKYDQYIFAANKADGFIAEMWRLLQSMPHYRDNTVMFITVDHGRGTDPMEAWQHHASKATMSRRKNSPVKYKEGIVGSDSTWMAAIGPDVPSKGLVETSDCLTSNRIAATLLAYLGLDYRELNSEMGSPLLEFQK